MTSVPSMLRSALRAVRPLLLPVVLLGAALHGARADVVTDWNDKACEIVATVGPGAPGHRLMAVVQAAVFEAVNAIEPRYTPYGPGLTATQGASVEAAVAAANRATLRALVAAERPRIDAAYEAAIATIADGPARADGIRVGEAAAALMLARAAGDGAGAADGYRWDALPGHYVPTVVPAATAWPRRSPWVLERPSQFRPGPPPDLASEAWARDLQEVRRLGEKGSTARSAQQTEIARFWEETRPLVYFPLLQAVARLPGRSVVQNARLYAAAALAGDDALIAVFDAKYHHGFWRPVAALRAGSGGVEAEPGWTPFVATPLHPEYPCAHCVLAGAYAAVIDDETRGRPAPALSTRSPSAPGVVRRWTRTDDFVDEVRTARIHGGVHFRSSTVVGAEMGRAVGRLVQQRFAAPAGL